MIIGGVNDSKQVIRTATFSKGNVAQELRRDGSCATLPFAVLVLRYLLYASMRRRGGGLSGLDGFQSNPGLRTFESQQAYAKVLNLRALKNFVLT